MIPVMIKVSMLTTYEEFYVNANHIIQISKHGTGSSIHTIEDNHFVVGETKEKIVDLIYKELTTLNSSIK